MWGVFQVRREPTAGLGSTRAWGAFGTKKDMKRMTGGQVGYSIVTPVQAEILRAEATMARQKNKQTGGVKKKTTTKRKKKSSNDTQSSAKKKKKTDEMESSTRTKEMLVGPPGQFYYVNSQ